MDIKNFFKPCQITKELEVSERFHDENSKICKFTIKSLSEIENESLKAQSFDSNGNFNKQHYITNLICASVVYPNLADSELQAYYNVLGKEKLIKTMLLSGEYAYLASEIQKICGFKDDIFESVDFLKN
ncbi:MAG: phage portal protein [Clostridia bacterium]